MANIINWTGVETNDGSIVSVDLYDDDTVTFVNYETEAPIATFDLATLATVTDGLFLDFGAGISLHAEIVAEVKRFCRI